MGQNENSLLCVNPLICFSRLFCVSVIKVVYGFGGRWVGVFWGGYANVEKVCTKQVSNTVGRGCRKFWVIFSKYWQTDSSAALWKQNSCDLSCVFLLRPAFSNFVFVGENVFTRDLNL